MTRGVIPVPPGSHWGASGRPPDNGVGHRFTAGRGKYLATHLIDLSPGDMARRLGDALAIYVDAMRYPRGTEDQRASMWLEHTRRYGWKAVAAVEMPDHSAIGN